MAQIDFKTHNDDQPKIGEVVHSKDERFTSIFVPKNNPIQFDLGNLVRLDGFRGGYTNVGKFFMADGVTVVENKIMLGFICRVRTIINDDTGLYAGIRLTLLERGDIWLHNNIGRRFLTNKFLYNTANTVHLENTSTVRIAQDKDLFIKTSTYKHMLVNIKGIN